MPGAAGGIAPATPVAGGTYSPGMGLIYIFNLIVGTGALTLPAAFSNAGWLISLCVILALALVSFITMTFVVESMGAANALLRIRRFNQSRKKMEDDRHDDDSDSSVSSSPTKSLLERVKVRKKAPPAGTGSHFYHSIVNGDPDNDIDEEQFDDNCDIQETVEMGKLAGMFFNRSGTVLFYICIVIYLYGDLAIYGAAVGKSLRDTACTYYPSDVPCNETLNGTIPCWYGSDISRDNAYRLFLSVFVMIIGAFGFFNVHKTMLLQVITSIVRWTAFIAMIVLACIRLTSSPKEDLGRPPATRLDGLPNLFGACVYSFMCHHSLPSLVTPIQPKRNLYSFLAADYLLIIGFYLLLGFTGIFAFPHLEDLYTLNFVPNRCPSSNSSVAMLEGTQAFGQQLLYYFLTLFPVFTLSTSFPIITITLRNNLKQLFLRRDESEYNFFIRRLLFPLLALIPPTAVAVATSDVSLLVGITGSYAGAGVQYVVPAFLAYYARRELLKADPGVVRNTFASPFRHSAFVWFTVSWAAACIAFVTYNHIAH